MNDGGAAFPSPGVVMVSEHSDEQYQQGAYEGMSLRDYFAAAAMQGMCAGLTRFRTEEHMEEIIVNRPRDVSAIAYVYADAMLKARSE